ncbi:hypothetical protein [Pedobacter montanisoli]|uniref:Uncharacterized protein n=1 Tax=Pedobacter montanisoli TaxID=2923277 RepID=A0ABS9ZZI5_9SPHI|nr:hypothetical protein [Pedobacter montanisoli]MCJ0743730.1 hypothetical protein [Pedobacter montanisoli]
MSDIKALISIVSNDFEVDNSYSEAQLRAALIKVFEYLVEDNFNKLLQILYRADVDQYKLKALLENTEDKSSAEIIADAYLERQKAKIEIRKKYSR